MTCNPTVDMCITQGDNKDYSLTITSGGAPQDLTGSTLFFTVKRNLSDTDAKAVIHKVITTFDDAPNGKATISLSNTDTDIPLARYFYDIQLTLPGNFVRTVVKGSFDVSYQVTETV